MSRFILSCCASLCALGMAPIAVAQSTGDSQPAQTLPAIAPAPMPAPEVTPPASTAPGPEQQRKVRVAIPNMAATVASDADLAKTLTQVLTIEVNKMRGIEAIGMADIEALLNHEQQKALLGCEQASCIAEIGGALGVDALLSSSIGRVGDTIVLSIQLNDTHAARKIGGAYETVEGKPDALIAVIQRKVPEVMKSAQPAWALDATTPQPRETGLHIRSGSEVKSLGFHVVWPAVGVAAVGGLALVVSGAIAAFSFINFAGGAENPSLEVGRNTFYAPGAQEEFDNGQRLAWVALVSTLAGATVIAGATAWQVIGGFANEEVAAP